MLWGYYTTNSTVHEKKLSITNLITPDNDYEGSVNSYAHVESYSWDETTQCTILMFNSKTTLNVDTDSFVGKVNTESMRSLNVKDYGSFKVNEEILVHVSTGTGESTSDKKEILGRCAICSIYKRDLINEKQALWINLNLEELFGQKWDTFNQTYTMQIVTVPFFNEITISTGCQLVPAKWNGKCGGILIFKSGSVNLNGGHINLYNRGLNDPSKRRLLLQEKNGEKDTDPYSGWENDDTETHCVLNSGDGVFILLTEHLYINNPTSRIGNPDLSGVSYCRGAIDTPKRFNFDTDNISNIGGSTILIKSGYYYNFSPDVIAKYRSPKSSTDKGLARCCLEIRYPAVRRPEYSFWQDGGLYSWRNYSNNTTYLGYTNIKDFGRGTLSSTSLSDTQLNNYASIAKIDGASLWVKKNTSKKIYKTTNGQIPFAVGTLVMLHLSCCAPAEYVQHGRFILCRITNILENYDSNTDAYVVDHAWSFCMKDKNGNYGMNPEFLNKRFSLQMISIPEYDSLSLKNQQFANLAMKFASDKNDTKNDTACDMGGYGGIVAIAVKNTLNIEGAKLLVTMAGGCRNQNTTTPIIGNAAMYNRLPIGEGHGSIFLLAKHIIMDKNTRLGTLNTGAGFGGYGGTMETIDSETTRIPSGGYRGHDGNSRDTNKYTPVYGGSPDKIEALNSEFVYPWRDDTVLKGSVGGYYGNGSYTSITSTTNHFDHAAAQGAHLFIVADSITGFNQNAIATGGEGGEYLHLDSNTRKSFIASNTFDPSSGSDDSLKADNFLIGFAGGPGGAGYGGGGASAHPTNGPRSSVITLTRSGSSGGFIRGGNGGTCAGCGRTGCSGGGTGWAFIYCNHAISQNTTGTIVD